MIVPRIAALLFLAGCASGAAMNVPPLILDLLVPVPETLETDQARQALVTLEPAYAHAVRLYDSRDYAAAAEAFLAAARAARGGPGTITREVMAGNRGVCYRNAARAWFMAGVLDEKRALLEEAAREDPLCATDIQEMIEILRGREEI